MVFAVYALVPLGGFGGGVGIEAESDNGEHTFIHP
jgi:hypothetical protein